MKIIDKIEIKHFRSFLGLPNEYEAIIYDLKDLNIFREQMIPASQTY